MCRYGLSSYKPHFGCFRCRKSFKRRLKDDVDPSGADQPARCPQCGLLMADLGLDFKAPKKDDLKAWAVLEKLWVVDVTFHSCGCSGPGYRPRSERDYRAFLEQLAHDYRQTLEAWRTTEAVSAKLARNREEALATWRARLTAVEEALQRAR
jgi:hypothetical protein